MCPVGRVREHGQLVPRGVVAAPVGKPGALVPLEVAILTVGAAFGARYELYAHEITAAEVGLTRSQIATLAAGNSPSELNDEETIAHEVARVLSAGRILPSSAYARACEVLGLDGVGELVFLISGYCQIAMILNAFDVPVPDADV